MASAAGLAERLRAIMTIDVERQAFGFKGRSYPWRGGHGCLSGACRNQNSG